MRKKCNFNKIKFKLNSIVTTHKQNNMKMINDELCASYDTISNELRHYENQLRGKKIYCPCDWDGELTDQDMVKCSFIRYLKEKKQLWGIRSISWSGWDPADPNNLTNLNNIKKFQDVNYDQYDVVITFPPVSQFLEFIDILITYPHLKFLVIGTVHKFINKNIFSFIQNNKMFIGYTHPKKFKHFNDENKSTNQFCWYTNLEINNQKEELILTDTYNSSKYQKYENYDAINVNRVDQLPWNYSGIIGVPIYFVLKHNPNQFKIIGVESYPNIDRIKTIMWFHIKGKQKDKLGNSGSKPFLKCKESEASYKHLEKEEFYREVSRIFIKNISK